MSDASSLRVADDDREQAVDELREHALAGRLTAEELEERIGDAYCATTRADLDRLKADLPVSSTTIARVLGKRKSQLRRRLAQEAGGSRSRRSAPARGSRRARRAAFGRAG